MRSLITKITLSIGCLFLANCTRNTGKSRVVEANQIPTSRQFSASSQYANGKIKIEFLAPLDFKDRTFELKSVTVAGSKSEQLISREGTTTTAVPVIESIEFFSKATPNTRVPNIGCIASGASTDGQIIGACRIVDEGLDKLFVDACNKASGVEQLNASQNGCVCKPKNAQSELRLFTEDYFQSDIAGGPMTFDAARFTTDCQNGEKIDCAAPPSSTSQIQALEIQYGAWCASHGGTFDPQTVSCSCRGPELTLPFNPKLAKDGGFIGCVNNQYGIDELAIDKIATEFTTACPKNLGQTGGVPPNGARPPLPGGQTGNPPANGATGLLADDAMLVTVWLNEMGTIQFNIKTAPTVTIGQITPTVWAAQAGRTAGNNWVAPLILTMDIPLSQNGNLIQGCRVNEGGYTAVPREFHFILRPSPTGGAVCVKRQ